MPELAKAYVQIIPSAEGIKGNLAKVMDGEAESAGKSAGGKFGNSFGSVAKAGLAAAGAGIAAGAAAAASMAKNAVQGYAEYEQLQGGLVTMFEDLAWDVEENAKRAFQTAGMSANEYMETVMGFSASLNQSLVANEGNIARAADLSDQIITDMADNANKMGTSMESIQNAYAGFAKQNYTMLDNLKLGYGGTKEEMERLLADAAELTGKKYDVSNFADIAEAIHAIQTEIGITGTTALEGSTTISGSLASMGSAWKNLVVGMASEDADLSGLINNVVNSAETAFGNILPVAEQALTGMASFVGKIAPVIAEKLPELVKDVLPSILTAATSLVTALVTALIDPENIAMLVDCALQLIITLTEGLITALPKLIEKAPEIIGSLVDTLTNPQNLTTLVDCALQLIITVASGLITALPQLVAKAPEIIMNLGEAIIRAAPMLLQAALELILTLAAGIVDGLGTLIQKGRDIVESVKDGFKEKVDGAKQWGQDLIENFVSGIKQKWEDLKTSVRNVAQTVTDFLGFSEPKDGPLSNFHTYAPDMMELFAKGIRDNEDLVRDQIADSFDFSDAMPEAWGGGQAAAVGRAGAFRFGGRGAASGSRTNTVTVNVYGRDGQNIRELALEVERVITQSIREKEAAWA